MHVWEINLGHYSDAELLILLDKIVDELRTRLIEEE